MEKKCPACQSEESFVGEKLDRYTMLRCNRCGLEFADPLACNIEEYKKAYETGEISDAGDYPDLFARIKKYLADNDIAKLIPILPAAYPFALNWIKNNIPRGSAVLDIGCGTGFFLAMLKESGFEALGLDIAPQPIQALQALGYKAFVGSIADYPNGCPKPDAIVLFEVIEHLESPVEFLKGVHDKFPGSPLLVTAPSPKRLSLRNSRREKYDYPPHHLTRWSAKALEIALISSGYTKAEVVFPPVGPSEIGLGHIGTIAAKFVSENDGGNRTLQKNKSMDVRHRESIFIKAAKRASFFYRCLLADYFTRKGFTAGSMLGIARS